MAKEEQQLWPLIVSVHLAGLRTFFTPFSYPLRILSTNSSPNVLCSDDSFNSFGLAFSSDPHSDKPELAPPPPVRRQRSAKMLNASIAAGVTMSSVGGSRGKVKDRSASA